ncbi:hypothetical protein CFP65_4117 [Kitasatospora sp. MMS16-BH015]|uniref:colicin D domain-containing protein n=1 Tax=Kitasatospora sp. MMS16-BH015 TaxID=2018025 RepID=UPI000CA0DB3E|nr:colicin D domain-containing protein [Kitasatospora sp. MMS16-BH015]AUG78875.1 hypothetical protein CFP65_4117 [Kitasatospora sp. MMS16-BH015]
MDVGTHGTPDDEVRPAHGTESTMGGSIGDDRPHGTPGLRKVYPTVYIPTDWDQGDEFIRQFNHIITKEWHNWPDYTSGFDPTSPLAQMQIGHVSWEACQRVKGGCPKGVGDLSTELAAAAAFELETGGGIPNPLGKGGMTGERPGGRPCNSFAPSTQVLMEGGKTKAISDIKVGDRVESGDPDTGEDQGGRRVTALHLNHDDDLVDLSVTTPDGLSAILHTTANHPFWDDSTKAWTPAGKLPVGDALVTASGQHAYISTVAAVPGAADMRNLTVDDLHTYYVLAGNTPVLVHNSGCGVSFSAKQLQKKYKHAVDFGVSGNWGKGSAKAFEDALETHIHDPSTVQIPGTYRGDPVTHYYNPNTELNVIVDPAGNFVSGWRLGPAQIQNVLAHGGLN